MWGRWPPESVLPKEGCLMSVSRSQAQVGLAANRAQPERLSSHRFIPTRRGPLEPPPLDFAVVFVPESQMPWWAKRMADGAVLRCCRTLSEAQQVFGYQEGASNG